METYDANHESEFEWEEEPSDDGFEEGADEYAHVCDLDEVDDWSDDGEPCWEDDDQGSWSDVPGWE